jgi:hypothetical protein
MDETRRIVTQIVIDHSGLNTSTAEFEHAMARHKKAYEDTGGSALSFDKAQRQWQNSLASTDPVLKAQIRMMNEVEKQTRIGSEAVKLGITTQAAHEAQIERVRQKYQGYVNDASKAASANTLMGRATGILTAQFGALAGALSVGAFVAFETQVFNTAAQLENQAKKVGLTVESLQVYRDVLAKGGLEAADADQIIQRLTKSLGAATQAPGTQRDALLQLGLTAKDIAAGPQAALPLVAKGLLDIKDANVQALLATELTGRAGQEIIPVLQRLSEGYQKNAADARNAGQVLTDDYAAKAKQALIDLNEASDKLKVAATPAAIGFATGLTDVLERMNDIAHADGFWKRIEYFLNFYGRWASFTSGGLLPADPKIPSKPATSPFWTYTPGTDMHNLLADYNTPTAPVGFGGSTPNTDKFFASQDLRASMAGLGPVGQSIKQADIDLANAKLKDGAAILRDQNGLVQTEVHSWKDVLQVTTAAERTHAETNARLITQGAASEKLKLTFDGYLAQLGEEARLAGLTTEERKQQEAVIKAARIQQREDDPNIRERDLIKNYAKGAEYLGQQKTQAVLLKEAQIDINALAARFADDANRAVKDYRDAVAAIAAAGNMTPEQKRVANDNLLQPSRRFQIETGQANPFGPAAQSGVNAALEQNSADQRSALLQNEQYFKSGQYGEGVSAEKKFADMRLGILQGYAEKAGQIEMSLAQQRIALGEQVAGSIADAMGNMFGRQSAEYRVAFGIQKAFATAQAVLALNEAILNAMTVPWPANIPAVATAIGLGATIMSNIASVAMPGYATGVVGLDGPGTGTSDSIVARLSRGESVVTASGTRGNESTLSAINRGVKYDRSANDNSDASRPIVVSPVFNMRIQGGDAKTAEKWKKEAISVVKDGMAEAVKQIRKEASDLYSTGARHPRRRAN